MSVAANVARLARLRLSAVPWRKCHHNVGHGRLATTTPWGGPQIPSISGSSWLQSRRWASSDKSGGDKSGGDKSGEGAEESAALNEEDLLPKMTGITPASTGTKVYRLGSRSMPESQLKQKVIDESDEATLNVDALAEAVAAEEAQQQFNPFPDMDTLEQVFDGIKFKDLPVVTIKCKKNSTRFWACDGSNRQLEYLTPKDFGFINAAGRTSVAAQAAAVNMGQRLRNRNVRTVKVRIDGFNLGRTAAVAGLVQAGIRVVSVTDCTEIDWHWRYRAKKRPRPYRVLF